MTEVAEQIQTELGKLIKERQRLERVLHDVSEHESRAKHDMHKLEADMFRNSMGERSQSKAIATVAEAVGIKYHHNNIQVDEKSIHQVAHQIKTLSTKIGTYQFWMKRSNVNNLTWQAEAHRHIFGR
jgi:hypothetical protein